MDKINILWIEDNPIQGSFYVKNLLKRDSTLKSILSEELNEFPIPAIVFSKKLEGYEKHFNVQVLQHPLEIKDFITMCLQLEDEKGVSAFQDLETVLPELIAFDYHFGEKITVNQGKGAMSYHPKTKAIREFINPNYRFLENLKHKELFKGKKFLLEQSESENYSQNDFLLEISRAKLFSELKDKDKADLIEDDFGLFSAIEILRIFREHSTVAIPATYVKSQTEMLSLHGKYFEWLNEYEYSVDFKREERGSKEWDSIIKDGMFALRAKIESHLRLGKIVIQFSHLNELTKKKLPANRVFTFESAYGVRNLPLDGLFIDKVGGSLDKEINVWATKLLKTYAEKTGFTFEEYKEAKQGSENLLAVYKTDLVDDRVELSKLIVRHLNGNIELNDKALVKKMKLFKVDEKEINEFKANKKNAKPSKITDNIHEFRSENEKVKKKATKRLIALMTDIRLHVVYQKFCEENATSNALGNIIKILKQQPTFDDLLFALYPVPESPLVLPYHLMFLQNVFDDDTMKKKLKQPYENWETALENLGLGKGQNFAKEISDGEKQVCLSFAAEEKLKRDNFPKWLLD